MRKFKVNVRTEILYSDILQKEFHIKVSSKALRTIRKYGSFDKYILWTKEHKLDSLFGSYLKKLMIKKQKDPTEEVPKNLPFTSKPQFNYKRRREGDYRDIPSIYIPPEVRRTDLSRMYYPETHFETRNEKNYREELARQIEAETDPDKIDTLKKLMPEDKTELRIRDEILALQPLRHKLIKEALVKYKDKPKPKFHFLKTIEASENFTKLVLQEKYKHFSEDYPEVQLILQQSEMEKVKKNKGLSKMYKMYQYNFGTAYSDSNFPDLIKNDKALINDNTSSVEFDPFTRKVGGKYGFHLNKKQLIEEKDRLKTKELKLIKNKQKSKKQEMKALSVKRIKDMKSERKKREINLV